MKKLTLELKTLLYEQVEITRKTQGGKQNFFVENALRYVRLHRGMWNGWDDCLVIKCKIPGCNYSNREYIVGQLSATQTSSVIHLD